MEPQVRYCTTGDGVRIAYTVSGDGPPIVMVNEGAVSHALLIWSQRVLGRFIERLAEENTLIYFDPRGSGLSDRVLPDGLDDALGDISAVVERVRVDRFALLGIQSGAPAAITYAAQNAERVDRLVLVDGVARLADLADTPQIRALRAAAQADFVMATELVGPAAFGAGREESREYGAYLRECVASDYFQERDFTPLDASAAARQVRAKTLLLRHAGLSYVTVETTRELAALIPNASLATVEGLWADDPRGVGTRAVNFINEEAAPAPAASASTSGVRTVLFTDIVGHTEMMRRLGDARGREVLRGHERVTRETLRRHGGAEVKTMGDGFMASFGTVSGAMECAIALQRAFHESSGEQIAIRVGINAGEPIEDEGDLFGSTVILASRVCAQAGAGEILVPEPVRHLLSGKGFLFADRGEFLPKGFEDAVRLFEVRWRE
jgi:class 3 adenylate cyclase